MLGNKEIMAINIKRYMQLKGVNSSEVCKALGFKQNTFSNWINAKIYPRIDKIEMMADYFGVSKADLVEEHKADIDSFVDLKFMPRKQPSAELSIDEEELLIEYRNAQPEMQRMFRQVLRALTYINRKGDS